MKLNALITMAATLLVVSTPLRAAGADERIDPSFQQTYVYRTYFTTNDVVNAGIQGGVVTLTGVVSDEFKKALAQETVALLPGVTLVDNHLEITGKIPAANSDAWCKAKVKNMLALHRCVSPRAEVDVKNGLVILRGQAISKNQSDLTSQYVYSVEGVKEVRNEMAVIAYPGNFSEARAPKIDDASITAMANLTMQYHSEACALANTVKTRDGVVLLSGTAREVTDQDVAAALITDIPGVRGVVDTHNGIIAYGYFDEPVREQNTPTDLMAVSDVILPSSPGPLPVPPSDTSR